VLLAATIAVLAVAAALAAAVVALRARRDAARAGDAARRAEDALAMLERLRAAQFERLPLIAVRVDGEGRIREANARALERFAHLRAGTSLLEGFGEHRLPDLVADVLATGAAREERMRLFGTDRRTFRVSAVPVEAGAGGAEALVFMTDLTEAIAYQELRSQFVANVSHELRTPLTGLRGLMEALGDPDMDPATHARFVSRASAEIQRLEALVTDILFLSELEATQGLPSQERSDLHAAARVAVEAFAPLAAEQRTVVRAEPAGETWTPLTERMARTVVQNLVENAIKYGGQGTTVVVRTAPARDGWVDLSVADDGAGIPERHLPHVFERFYRADPSRSKRLGGTGLGLSIVKHIAERVGGRAEAVSREGFGTTVTVRLPVVPPPGAGPPEAPDGGDRAAAPSGPTR
jgi:two-component system phosphate regulon sensor histidine kinase PhoR